MSSPEVSREELLLDLARRLDDCLIEARDLLVQRGAMKRKYRETGIKNEDAWHRVNSALRQAQERILNLHAVLFHLGIPCAGAAEWVAQQGPVSLDTLEKISRRFETPKGGAQ